MSSRDHTQGALFCWLVLILIGYSAQHLSAPEERERVEAHGYHLLAEQFLIDEREARELSRLELLDMYRDALGGYRPVLTRLRPIPDLSPQRHGAVLEGGALDGISIGDGVVGRTGVIGIVVEVSEERSRIIFSDDPEFRVSFEIPDKGRGIAAGGPTRGELHPAIRLEAFTFAAGDLLLTRGGDSPFPRSILIGEVEEARIPIEATRITPPPGLADPQDVLVLTLPHPGGTR